MAISQVRAQINGTWHTLAYNASSGKYEKSITAPNVTSYNVNSGHYYPVTIEATNTAGTKRTVNDATPDIGDSLKLRVLERVAPTITITSPGAGAHVTNNKQPIVFQLRDEAQGSGIKISTLALKIDGGAAQGQGSSGMVCNTVANGYDCTYTPPSALSDGSHTVTINVSDNDGNAASQASRTYYIDTVPPALNVTNPASGFITNNPSMTVQGTTNDSTSSPVTITIKLNGVDQGAVTVSSGAFSKSITLAEGNNSIEVKATDSAGQVTTVAATGTLDTSVPQITVVEIVPNPVDAGATMVVKVAVSG